MTVAPLISTTCSTCTETVLVYRVEGVVSSRVPSNGVRGAGHKPAHLVQSEVDSDDSDLVTWDCPRCGEADSFDLND